jgi:hypothetical protein
MDAERLDRLVATALETGAVPPGLDAEERAEVEAVLNSAAMLRATGSTARAEARASMPTARARFERFVDAATRPSPAPIRVVETSRPRGGIFGGVLAANRAITWSVAAVALVALLALAGSRVFFTGVETAAAFSPGDYVQLEGVVSAATGTGADRQLDVSSDIGNVSVDVTKDTSVVDETSATDASAIVQGAPVVVGGVVGKDRRIAANTLALSAAQGVVKPLKVAFKELRDLKAGLQGKVVTFALSPDGSRAAVVIETKTGERLLVHVDGKSAEKLLNLATALGATVNVLRPVEGSGGLFSLTLNSEPPEPSGPPATAAPGKPQRPDAGQSAGRPALVSVRGVITARQGNVIQVQTRTGPLTVVARLTTRILPGDSGLTREGIAKGESVVGHVAVISGGLEPATGRVIADVIVLGQKLP